MENRDEKWNKTNFQDFWAEIAPSEHVVQVYDSENVFINTLEGFVGSGFLANEIVIIIATKEHLDQLNFRLEKQKFNLNNLIDAGKYFPLNASSTLDQFMRNGWPDESLFFSTVNSLFKNANKNGNKIRAFGEMVAILWEQKNFAATIHLEHLWNKFCKTQNFCLYCAYPKSGFTKDPATSIREICCTHTRVISGSNAISTEIHYTDQNIKAA